MLFQIYYLSIALVPFWSAKQNHHKSLVDGIMESITVKLFQIQEDMSFKVNVNGRVMEDGQRQIAIAHPKPFGRAKN